MTTTNSNFRVKNGLEVTNTATVASVVFSGDSSEQTTAFTGFPQSLTTVSNVTFGGAVVNGTVEANTIRKAGYPGLANMEIQGNLTPQTSGQSDLGAGPSGANKQFGYVYANTASVSSVLASAAVLTMATSGTNYPYDLPLTVKTYSGLGGGAPESIFTIKSRGTAANPLPVQQGDNADKWQGVVYTGAWADSTVFPFLAGSPLNGYSYNGQRQRAIISDFNTATTGGFNFVHSVIAEDSYTGPEAEQPGSTDIGWTWVKKGGQLKLSGFDASGFFPVNTAIRLVPIKSDFTEVVYTFGSDGNLTFPDSTVQSTAFTGFPQALTTVSNVTFGGAVVNGTIEANTIRKAGYPGLSNLEIQGNLTPQTSGQSDLGAGPSGANKQFGYVYANTGSFTTVVYNRSYGSFANTATITAAAADTAYILPINATTTASNMTLTNTGTITINKTDKFNIQFSLQLSNSDSSSEHIFNIWLRENGSDVPDSNTQYTVIKSNGKNVAALNFLVDATAGDTYELMYAVNNTAVTIEGILPQASPYVRPGTPSVLLTVVPVGA